MELIVISNEAAVVNEAKIINGLFQLGLKRFHLRKPNWDELKQVELLMQIDPEFYSGIALHQHHNTAALFDIKLLHYTEKERLNTPPQHLNQLKQQGYTLSTSVHHLSALQQTGAFSSAFFGPVFNSISKPGYESKLPNNFCMDKKGIGSKVIALGGINETNLNKIKRMNFDGAAVLGAIWQQPLLALQAFDKLNTLI